MNKHCYRMVFNKARGILMAVSEIAVSQGKASGETSGKTVVPGAVRGSALRALTFSAWATLAVNTAGLILWPAMGQAQIVADPNAPANQRPTVLAAPNGVPLVNIQTPSAAGVSRNTYRQFDVLQQGAILNNSRSDVQTQLGAWVQGNPWLATGSARVILNEVNSNNPSLLQGYVEVAGSRAEVIIANPAGIACDGGGFINASRATLTTGTPIFNGGNLEGYRVQGGAINITGAGLDAGTADYTDLIARSVQVNAGIWANQLKVTAGANQVDAEHTAATPIAGTGAAPAFAIDVAQLGGMYAGKITLIGTETGVGVRNAGNIGASVGEVIVTAEGRLENAGRITSASHTQIDTSGGIDNSGTIYAQGNASLSTRDNIDNSGVIAALGNATLAATGANSRITSTNSSVLGAGVQTDGSLGNGGALSVNASKTLTAQGQNLSGGEQTLAAQAINLSGSQTSASDLHLSTTQGDIDLTGATVAASQTLTANASQTLRTDQATLSATQINASAHDLSNVQGEIVQVGSGDLMLNLPGNLDNTQGRIATNSQNLNLAAVTLTNTGGTLEHAGNGRFQIGVGVLSGVGGQISSNGLLDLTAISATIDGGTTSAEQVRINSNTLSNRGGTMIQTGTDATTITANIQLDNTGGVISSNGTTTLTVGDLANQGGTIQAAGNAAADLQITAGCAIDNSAAGSIAASGNTTIIANSLDNTQGQVTAGQGLSVAASQALTNAQGMLAANLQVNVSANQIDNAQGTIGSIQDQATVTASAGALDNTAGRIEAAQAVFVTALGLNNTDGVISGSSLVANSNAQTFDNTRGKLTTNGASDSGALNIQGGALNNDAGLIQAQGALAIDTHGQTLTNIHSGNNGGIVGQSSVSLATGNLDNHTGYIGSNGAFTSVSAAISNTQGGILTSAAQMDISGSSLDNQGGQIQAVSDIGLSLNGVLNNTASLVRSGQILDIAAGSIVNANTQGNDQGLEGQSVSLNAQQINNQQGAVRADNALTMTSHGSINNTQGLISSGETVTLQDSNLAAKVLAITNTNGTVIAGQQLNIDSAGLTGDGKALSQGDLSVKLTQNYTHTGEFQANGSASLETTGTLTNQSTLLAGTALNLKAASIDNQANGQISANQVKLEATDSHTLTNRGLIDGQDTIIETATLNNLGTGRIYGDHIAIGATTVTNNVENGIAPVIAARDRLDIGAQTITNREHALIFSAGDMAIGGSLDANKQATGQAATLNNNSATIEALGNMAISAANINNTNEHFSTQIVTVSTTAIDEHQGYGASNRYPHSDAYTANVRDSFYQWIIHGTSYFKSYEYIYNRTVTETQQLSSDPARILAGGGITLNVGQTYNDKSQIIAGGNIDVSGGSVTNTTVAGIRTTTDAGTTLFYLDHQPGGGGNDWTEIIYSGYNPASTVQAININPTVYQQNTAPTGTGAQISALSTGSVNQTPSGAQAAGVTINNGSVISPITQVAALNGNNAGGPAIVVRSGGVNISVPNNSLFSLSSNPNSGYLIETDQRFANYRNWLSSDYLLSALSINPATTQKRLGDGFYEQKLIREQVAQLTGRRFLEGYASDEAQYQALMGNASTFAQAHQLRPGVALSAEQMAQLTSDIVWLVEKDITLPNGQTTKALVPQVYVRVQDGDLSSSGALISGASVAFNLSGDLTNSGTIAGRNVVALTAENVHNLGGRITGNDVGVAARTDLNNIGGQIDAANSLVALAGRDLNVVSTTRTQTSAQGSRTNIDRVAGLYVTGSNGTLIASAGRDLNLIAADIVNGVPNAAPAVGQPAGSTELVAGRNLNLGTVSEAQRHDLVWDPRNFRKESSRADVGTTIQTTGDIHLQAGNDLNAKAASVTSDQGALMLTAGNDLNIVTGSASLQRDEASYSKSRGTWGSKSEVATRDTTNETTALGSTFSGDTVTAQAGHDLNVKGSNVVATNDVTLLAQNNVKIEAAANTLNESHFREEKRSGLFGSGGLGITIGSQKKSTDNKGVSAMATASMVGSTEGNVTIAAGNDFKQVGSNVVAPQGDIDISAQKIDIIEAQNTSTNTTETKFKQTGLTLALSSPVISAVQTAQHMAEAAGETKDARMQALAGATAGMAAYDAYGKIQAGQGTTVNGKDNQIVTGKDADGNLTTRDANAVDKVGGINLSISLGGSSSQSNSTQTSSTAQGSTVAAGNNVNLTATGAGKDSDLTVQGSQVTAGNNVTLKADDNINLFAAKSTAEQHSTNKSSSGSIGVSVGSDGFMVNASASKGRGNADGSDVTYSNTHIEAGNTLALQSGNDTTLKGVVASGKQVVVEVGGNLNVESLQDTSQYDSKQSSVGGSISVGYGKMSGSVNVGKSNANSTYASVVEQSGIKAGDEGFQVNVSGNTDLKGAVIASTDKAIKDGKNSLVTATLTTNDIANHAEASAKSSGISLDSSMVTQGKYGIAKGVIGNALNNASESGSSSGQTRTAISEGTVIITDQAGQQQSTGQTAKQTVASLNRDTATAQTAAQRLDVQAMERTVAAERVIKEAVYKEAVKFIDESYRTTFLKKAEVYELGKDKDGNITRRALSESEKMELKPGADGKVHIVDNGIFNNAVDASGNGAQHSATSDPLYLVHFPEANNGISEFLVAGYQKFLEGDALGLANATQETKNIMNTYGQQGLVLDGHSRGSLTIDNAMESMKNQVNAVGILSGTDIRLFGPAQNVLNADNTLAILQNRDAVTDLATKNSMVIRYQVHVADPVGTLLGLNDSTGGTVPEGSSVFTEQVRAATGQESTSHNLYFTNLENFKPKLPSDERKGLINDFWGGQTPALVPVRTYPITGIQQEVP